MSGSEAIIIGILTGLITTMAAFPMLQDKGNSERLCKRELGPSLVGKPRKERKAAIEECVDERMRALGYK